MSENHMEKLQNPTSPYGSVETLNSICQFRKHLSEREIDVLGWLTCGKAVSDIAQLLGISVCTVRVHCRNIIRKLRAQNMTHAVAIAYKCKLL